MKKPFLSVLFDLLHNIIVKAAAIPGGLKDPKVIYRFRGLIATFIILIGFFVLYNRLLIDNTLENLKFSLEQTALAQDIEGVNGLDMVINQATAKEISPISMNAFDIGNLEYATSIVNTGTSSNQLEYMKKTLSTLIGQKEEERGPILAALDRINRPIRRGMVYLLHLPNYIFRPLLAHAQVGEGTMSITLMDRVRAIERAGDLEKAVLEYERLIIVFTETDKASLLKLRLAYTYQRLGEYDKAVKLYKQILWRYYPDRQAKIARIFVDMLKQKNKLLKETDLLILRYVETPRDNIEMRQDIFYQIGTIYMRLFNLVEAKKFFNRAIKLDPSTDIAQKAQFNLAWALKQEYKLAESLEGFSMIMEQKPDSKLALDSRYQTASVLHYQGKYKEAIAVEEDIAEKSKDYKLASLVLYQIFGSFMYDLDDDEAANKISERLEKEYPTNLYTGHVKISKEYLLPTALVYFAISIFLPLVGLISTIFAIGAPIIFDFLGGRLYLGNLIFAVSFAAFLINNTVRNKLFRLFGRDVFVAFLPFILVLIASGLYNLRGSFTETGLARLASFTLRWMEMPVAFIFVSNVVRSKRSVRAVAYFSFAAAIALSLYALRAYLYMPFEQLFDKMPAITAFFKSGLIDETGRLGKEIGLGPNIVGIQLAMAFPIAIALIFMTPSKLKKIILAFLTGITLFVLTLTFSKNAIFSLFVGMATWATVLKRRKKISVYLLIKKRIKIFILLLITIVIVIAIFRWWASSEQFRLERLNPKFIMTEVIDRIAIMHQAIMTSLRNPLTGVGPGNFGVPQIWDQSRPAVMLEAHNLLIQILVETGIFGVLAYLYFLKVIILKVKNNLKPLKQLGSPYILASALAVSFLVFLTDQIVDINIWHGIGIQAGINIGLLNAMANIE
ncbi:MAG: tetratricopeptide repeat protein [Candidatus Omnitrophica bacterium]|nr:tetratricopeptide repeat protein [Candidatus Omnitrophota bacterium]